MKSPRKVFQNDPEFWGLVMIEGAPATEHIGPATHDRGERKPEVCWLCNKTRELSKILRNRGREFKDQYAHQALRREAFIQFWGEKMVYIHKMRVTFDNVEVIPACGKSNCLNPLHLTVTLKSGVYPKGLKTVYEKAVLRDPKNTVEEGFHPKIDRQLTYRKALKGISNADKVDSFIESYRKGTARDIRNNIRKRIIGDRGGYKTHRRTGVLSDTSRFFDVPMKNVLEIYFDMIQKGEINP